MEPVVPNYKETIGFLEAFHPTSWWVLCAIPVDGDAGKKEVLTETFEAGAVREVTKWLEQYGDTHNLYFHPATTKNPMNKKVRREDVEEVSWLHVDVDPRAGEDIDEERERIVKVLTNPPKGLHKPTAIIFSGGGYQAYWKLSEPIKVHGIIDRANEAARYNLQIERIFGADSCHSIDHLMRLPGTVNRPDERKRKKNRVDTLAVIVEWDDSREYEISDFSKATEVQNNQKSSFSGTKPVVNISGNIARLGDVDDLPDRVSDTVKATIVHGEHPTEPERHHSRSEVLWWVVCELTRAEVDPDIIYSVITDESFEISSSVLDKGHGAHNYALKQINNAKEKAIDPNLYEMNSRYAAVKNYGGFCIVYEEEQKELNRDVLKRIGPADLKAYYANRKVKIGEKDGEAVYAPLGNWWLTHPHRRQYEGICFYPNGNCPDGYYNLWQGYAVAALPGDNHQKFLDHLFHNVCQGVDEYYNYLIGWMANMVQYPGWPGHVAVVMRGKRGVGKSICATVLSRLFGRHYMNVTNPSHLVGRFNGHLRDVVFLFGDEAFWAGDKKHESVLKTIITERTVVSERKGIDADLEANCLHLMMASNEDWVVPAGYRERRFFVLDVGDSHIQDQDYFSSMIADLEDGGYESLLHFLLNYDLTGFKVRSVPDTEALREQIMHSMPPEVDWWLHKLAEGVIDDEDDDWPDSVWKLTLYLDYVDSLRLAGRNKRSTEVQFGKLMVKLLPKYEQIKKREPQTIIKAQGKEQTFNRPVHILLPTLAECRAHFDREFGGPFNWSKWSSKEEPNEYQSELHEGETPF